MRIARLANGVFCVLLLSLIVGCSSKPSEIDVRQRIEQQISQNANGLIKLSDFRKTNGIEGGVGNSKIYTMEWVADLEFTDDCMWRDSDFRAIRPQDFSLLNIFQHRDAKKGDRISLSGSTTLLKTENGWR